MGAVKSGANKRTKSVKKVTYVDYHLEEAMICFLSGLMRDIEVGDYIKKDIPHYLTTKIGERDGDYVYAGVDVVEGSVTAGSILKNVNRFGEIKTGSFFTSEAMRAMSGIKDNEDLKEVYEFYQDLITFKKLICPINARACQVRDLIHSESPLSIARVTGVYNAETKKCPLIYQWKLKGDTNAVSYPLTTYTEAWVDSDIAARGVMYKGVLEFTEDNYIKTIVLKDGRNKLIVDSFRVYYGNSSSTMSVVGSPEDLLILIRQGMFTDGLSDYLKSKYAIIMEMIEYVVPYKCGEEKLIDINKIN